MQESLRGPRTRSIFARNHRWLKFGIVGTCGAIVNTAVLTVLYRVMHLPLVPSSVTAVEVSIISNYLLNDRWTFHRRRPSWRLLMQNNAATAVVLAVTPTVVWLLVQSGVHFLVANMIGIVAGTALNVTITTLWVRMLSRGGLCPWSISPSPYS
jgi:dolichol-phosphate mannosyltransferase